MDKIFAKCLDDQKIIDILLKRIEKLEEEVKNLKEKHDEYELRHPANVGVKNAKVYEIKKENQNEDKKKPGAVKGHQGHFRAAREPDTIITLDIDRCPYCDSELSKIQEIRKRYVEDIPPVKPILIEYDITRKYCSVCNRVVEAPVPDVLPNSRFSIKIMLMVAYYKIIMRMSLENVSKMMEEMYNLKISEGEIQKMLSTVSEHFEDLYGEIQEELRASDYRHMDSTSWRIDGSNDYLWTFVTRESALFSITDKNNHEVPETILGDHNGVDIHDRYSAFETFAKNSKNEQQYCWSHIIRDAKELEDFYGEEGGRIHRIVKRIYEKAKAYKGKGTDEDISKLYGELEYQLNTQYDKSKCRKYVETLLKRKKEWLFNFVKNDKIEGTNNRAERALRPSVIYRKVSGESRSERGAKAYSRIYTVFYTMKLRDKNIMKEGPPILLKSSKNT